MKFLHILTFLLLFTPIFLNIPTIQAQDSFEEEVRITAAGPMTFWEIELSGVNLTSYISLEDINLNGLNEFTIITSKNDYLVPQIDIFQSNGYDIIPEHLVDHGITLQIDSSSNFVSNSLIAELETFLDAMFIPYTHTDANGKSVNLYYSSTDFNRVARVPFFEIFANSNEGFNALITTDNIIDNLLPIVTLHGENIGNEIVYSLTISGFTDGSSDKNSLNLDLVFPNNQHADTNIKSSELSDNSVISINNYGSYIQFSSIDYFQNMSDIIINYDTEHYSNEFKSSLEIVLSSGQALNHTNYKIMPPPPSLKITREIDSGVFSQGDEIEYRVTFEHLSTDSADLVSVPIQNIYYDEDWWSPHLTLLQSTQNETSLKLYPDESATIVNRFSVNTGLPVTIQTNSENSIFEYEYVVDDEEFTDSSNTLISSVSANDIVLSLNDRKPVLFMTASLPEDFSPLISKNNNINASIEIQNVGIGSIFSGNLYFGEELVKSIPAITPNSKVTYHDVIEPHHFKIQSTNHQWTLEWDDSHTITSNSITLIDDVSMSILPMMPNFEVRKFVNPVKDDDSSFVTELIMKNNGPFNLTNIKVEDNEPLNSVYVKGNISKSNNGLSTSIESLAVSNLTAIEYTSSISNIQNIISTPAQIQYEYGGNTFIQLSNSIVKPIAMILEKQIDHNSGVVGFDFTVNWELRNPSLNTIYAVDVNGQDSEFIHPDIQGIDGQYYESISPGESVTKDYVISSRKSHNTTVAPAQASFILAGRNVDINSDNFILEIVDTPKISFSVLDNKPLVENQEFDLIIEISNPSKYILDNVELSNANFTNLEFINEIELSKISTIGANDKIQLHAKLKPIQADTEVMFDPTITYIFREQNIDVFFQEYKNIANENIINRYVPTTFLGIIFVLATIIIAQRNLKK